MGHFSVEIYAPPGSDLSGNQQTASNSARVASLQDAGPGSLTFLANPHYRRHLAGTRATAVVLDADSAAGCPVEPPARGVACGAGEACDSGVVCVSGVA